MSDVSRLADINYSPLIEKLSKDAKKKSKCDLSWTGCLATFKKFMLPQISYLFRTLSIPIKKPHVMVLNKILKNLVWQNMKPHCSHAQLLKHKCAGGMGMIDLLDYWVATHLSQFKSWFLTTTDRLWVDVEQHCSSTPSLKNLLLANTWKPRSLTHLPLST